MDDELFSFFCYARLGHFASHQAHAHVLIEQCQKMAFLLNSSRTV